MIGFIMTAASPVDSSVFSYQDVGIFILAIGLLKLVNYLIKKIMDKKDNGVAKDLKDKVDSMATKVDQLYDIHCGPQATAQNGRLRIYFPDEMTIDVKELAEDIKDIKEVIKAMGLERVDTRDLTNQMKVAKEKLKQESKRTKRIDENQCWE